MILSSTTRNEYVNNNYCKKNCNKIAFTNDPPTRLNGLLDAWTVLIRLPHNVGSRMMLSCREFGRV